MLRFLETYEQYLSFSFLIYSKIYLNPTAACQTKANNKKKTGIIGNTSTIGLNATYASGKRANTKLSIIKTSIYLYIYIYNTEYIKFNITDFTLNF